MEHRIATGDVKSKRYLSLDVFRGITVCLMIIVNSPGKGAPLYSFLVHAQWFGVTLADLVFPSFLFAMGNAMSFSFSKPIDNTTFIRKVFFRSLLIFVIGYLMYWFPFVHRGEMGWEFNRIHDTRIMGVLQRIALCYLSASLLVHFCSTRVAALVAGLTLILYWGILFWFGVDGEELTMSGNAIVRLDLLLFGESHVYKKDLIPFDPEGLLSTLPAIVNVLAGYWVGLYLQRNTPSKNVLRNISVVGIALVAFGIMWSAFFPMSKKLWTSSFTLYTIGWDIIAITLLVYVIEVVHYRRGFGFFTIFGKNTLFVYLFSELVYVLLVTFQIAPEVTVFEWISIEIYQKIAPGPIGSLLTAISFMLCCWVVGWWLDRRKIYIKI